MPTFEAELEVPDGWTEEEFRKYLAEREAASANLIDPKSDFRRRGRRPMRQNSSYSVLKWRR